MNDDRWREQLQAEVLAHAATARERDRLRAVVGAARTWWASYDRVLADLTREGEEEHLAAIDAVKVALDALDRSGEVTDG